MNEIEFSWSDGWGNPGSGSMTVYLQPFFDGCTVADAKKLLGYIQKSNQPEIVENLKLWVIRRKADCDSMVIALNDKVPLAMKQVDKAVQWEKKVRFAFRQCKNKIDSDAIRLKTALEEAGRSKKEAKENLQDIKADIRKTERLKDKLIKIEEMM